MIFIEPDKRIKPDKRTPMERLLADLAEGEREVEERYPDFADQAKAFILEVLDRVSPCHAEVMRGQRLPEDEDRYVVSTFGHLQHIIADGMQNLTRQGRPMADDYFRRSILQNLSISFDVIESDQPRRPPLSFPILPKEKR